MREHLLELRVYGMPRWRCCVPCCHLFILVAHEHYSRAAGNEETNG
jgi:hypothetical protein